MTDKKLQVAVGDWDGLRELKQELEDITSGLVVLTHRLATVTGRVKIDTVDDDTMQKLIQETGGGGHASNI